MNSRLSIPRLLILHEKYMELPDFLWAGALYKDGSSLPCDDATVAWLISNGFRRVSTKYRTLCSAAAFCKPGSAGYGFECRCNPRAFQLHNVPRHLYIQLPVAR